MEYKDGCMAVKAENRNVWRIWLELNHATEKSVLLIIYHKKSPVSSIRLDEELKEVLCFGWIDSKGKKRDNQSYYVTFTPRKARSRWSALNILEVKKLIANGLMTEHGLKAVEMAIEKGTWNEEG